MPHPSKLVANRFIELAHQHRESSHQGTFYLSALELQKLVVIAHGLHVYLGKGKLVSDTLAIGEFEPTFCELEIALSIYGDNPVTNAITDGSEVDVFLSLEEFVSVKLPDESNSTIEAIWQLFKENKPTCDKLSLITRGEESDWIAERDALRKSGTETYPEARLSDRIKDIINHDDQQKAA